MTVTLANTGGSSFQIKSYLDDSQFRVVGGSCLTLPVVAAGASCTFAVTYTPTIRGAATGALTITTDVLAPFTIATAGSSPTTVPLSLGSKTFSLAYPTPISSYLDTDPATLPSDVTASLWNLVAGVSTLSNGSGGAVTLSNAQPLSSIQWPIRFGYWLLRENLTTTRGTGCQLDLVSSNLVLTANGVSTSVPVDGTPPVLNSLGQAIYPGDTIKAWVSLRTIGTVSVIRAIEIDAFDGALLGNATAIHLSAFYDSHGAGAYGNATATRQTATTLQQYACSDTP